MDYKKIEEILDKLSEIIEEKLRDKKEKSEINEKAYEESKKELKKDILSRIDKAKNAVIVLTDDIGTIIGKREYVINSAIHLLSEIYDCSDTATKKLIKKEVNDEIFED